MVMSNDDFVEDPKIMLDEILKTCMDAPGYVVFAAAIGTDPKTGGQVLNFQYRRYHLGIEDVKLAVKGFQDEMINDLKNI